MIRRHAHQPAQAVVLVALVLVLLVALVGLGVDGAYAFAQRRNANIAADSAAMAGARALLDANLDSSQNHNSTVYNAIDSYLNAHLSGSSAGSISWTAYYISKVGMPIGSAIANDSSSVPQVKGINENSNDIRGVSVELHYTFHTFFMPLMGRDTLNAQAFGLAFVGPLGGASGVDIVPLAINRTWASLWSRSVTGTAWDIDMFSSTVTTSTSGHIGTVDLRQVTLLPDGPAPPLGSTSSCNSYSETAFEDNLSYWWCKGSAHRLVSDTEQQTLAVPVNSALKNAVDWRISQADRSTVLFPVYERLSSGGAISYNIRGFMAIKLVSRSGNVVRGELVKYYSAPGPINGNTTSFFGTFAINLVQ